MASARQRHTSYSRNQVQIDVQCFVDEPARNSAVHSNAYEIWRVDRQPRTYTLWKGPYSFLEPELVLKLDAQTTSKRPKRRNQHSLPILAVQGDVALRQNIVAIGDRLPAAQAKSRQRLADTDVQIGVHLVQRLAVADPRERATRHSPICSRRSTLVPERGTLP